MSGYRRHIPAAYTTYAHDLISGVGDAMLRPPRRTNILDDRIYVVTVRKIDRLVRPYFNGRCQYEMTV